MSHNVYIQSNLQRNLALLIVLRITVAFLCGRLIFELFRFSVWKKIDNGVPITLESFERTESISMITMIMQSLLTIGTIVVLIVWMYRAYDNLKALKTEPTKWQTYWAALGWFVPVVNYWVPFAIVSEILKGYETTLIQREYIRHDSTRKNTLNWWWITYIAATVVQFFSIDYTLLGVFASNLSIVLMIISLVLLIRAISSFRILEKGIADLDDVEVMHIRNEDVLDSEY